MALKYYHLYEAFAEVLDKSDDDYNRQCDVIEIMEESKKAFVITPTEPVVVSRIESDMEKHGDLYELGKKDMLEKLEDLKKYLSQR